MTFEEFLLEKENQLDITPIDPKLIQKASQGHPESMEAVSKGVFGRSFKLADKDTDDLLKPMDIIKTIKGFDVIEKLADKFGYKFRYFTSNPKDYGKTIEGIKIEQRPANIAKDGYSKGNIWVYNPYDEHGSFNDALLTHAWRAIHELGHALSEAVIHKKYGWSLRFGAMTFDTKNPYNISDTKIYKGIPLLQAQRAIEWEDVAFRTQELLYKELGLKVPQANANLDFNIAGHDAVIRILTGDFSDPGTLGVIPNSNKKVSVKAILQFLENQYEANAKHLGRETDKGLDLSSWKPISNAEIMAEIKKAEKK